MCVCVRLQVELSQSHSCHSSFVMSGSLDTAWVKMMKNELNDDLLFESSASSSSDTEASDETIGPIEIDSHGRDDGASGKKSSEKSNEKQQPAEDRV